MRFWHALKLNALSPEVADLFCSMLSPIIVRADTVLYQQGAHDCAIYFVVNGKCEVSRGLGDEPPGGEQASAPAARQVAAAAAQAFADFGPGDNIIKAVV
jgi:CRP-like cAMP-binding protein